MATVSTAKGILLKRSAWCCDCRFYHGNDHAFCYNLIMIIQFHLAICALKTSHSRYLHFFQYIDRNLMKISEIFLISSNKFPHFVKLKNKIQSLAKCICHVFVQSLSSIFAIFQDFNWFHNNSQINIHNIGIQCFPFFHSVEKKTNLKNIYCVPTSK